MSRTPLLSLAPALLTALLLSGCGSLPTPPASTADTAAPPTGSSGNSGSSLQGNVQAQSEAIVGAHVYLFAANTTGYGQPSISLLNSSQPGVASDATGAYVTSDAAGKFSITGDYICSPGQQVYVLATGGNPGLPNNATNPLLTMVSILGTCPAGATSFVNTVSFISINEITTVASVYALSGYMTDATHVSSSGTPAALQGIANAFLAFNNLASLTNGTALSQSVQGNGDVPQAEINTLANILIPCINSNGATPECANLFTNSKDASGNLPADPVSALLNIAHNPAANVANLFNLSNVHPGFQPALAAAPNDWTLAITFYSDTMVGPYFPAIDSTGNLWVPGYASANLTQFDTLGNILSGNSGFTGGGLNLPYAVAIDAHDSAWVTNYAPIGSSTISKFLNNGFASATPYACSTACYFMAFDTSQNLWISGSTQTTVLQNSGTLLTRFPTSGTNSGIAIDPSGNTWTIGQPRNLYRLGLPAVLNMTPESVTAGSGTDLTGLDIDSTGNVWFSSGSGNAIGEADKSGNLLSPSGGYTGGGLSGPAQLAIDGSNRVWVANRNNNTISAFSNTGKAISPGTGFQAPGLSGPRGLAIDESGNIWVTNFTFNSVTEFIGLATPISTPITPTTHGQRP